MLALSDAQPQWMDRTISLAVPFLNRVRANAYNLHIGIEERMALPLQQCS